MDFKIIIEGDSTKLFLKNKNKKENFKRVKDKYFLIMLNKNLSLNRLGNIFMFFIVLSGVSSFFGYVFLFGLLLKLRVLTYKKVKLNYDIDDYNFQKYKHLLNFFAELSELVLWQDKETIFFSHNKHYSKLRLRSPKFTKFNVPVCSLKLNKMKLHFMPDCLIVFEPSNNYISYSYDEIDLEVKSLMHDFSIFIIKSKDFHVEIKFGYDFSYNIELLSKYLLQFKTGKQINISNSSNSKELNTHNYINLKEIKLDLPKEIELPTNKQKYVLPSTDILSDEESKNIIPFIQTIKKRKGISVPIGYDENGELIIDKLGTMPNILIGGTVMSGKTTFIHNFLTTLMFTKKPSEVKLIIYTTKQIDYYQYNDLPHLLTPIITDFLKINRLLQNLAKEVDKRIDKLVNAGCKSVNQYNKIVNKEEKIPDIVLIIDDLSEVYGDNEFNDYLGYILLKCWNLNIHLILVSNYPSPKVIPDSLKFNIPSRLCFPVTSSKVSKMVIGSSGAESLKEKGTAYYKSNNFNPKTKIKAPYIVYKDRLNIIKYCQNQQAPNYDIIFADKEVASNFYEEYEDPIYNEVVEFAIENGKISASLLQRRFRVGYNRAARIIDLLEERGIVGPPNGSKPREVLVSLYDNSTL